MFPLIYLSDFTAWSLITWLANPQKKLLRKQLLATLKLSNGDTPAILLPVQHQHNLQSSFLKQRFDLFLAENTYSINTKREWNEMSSVTWKIPFHSTCEKEMVSKGNVDSANLRICTLLNFNFFINSACDEIFLYQFIHNNESMRLCGKVGKTRQITFEFESKKNPSFLPSFQPHSLRFREFNIKVNSIKSKNNRNNDRNTQSLIPSLLFKRIPRHKILSHSRWSWGSNIQGTKLCPVKKTKE